MQTAPHADPQFHAECGGEPKFRPDEGAMAELAARQHGVLSRRQLYELGFGPRSIDRRLEIGRLHRLHRGVYAVGHRGISGLGHWMAAVLACGPTAVLSHRSAAALWGLRPSEARLVDVAAQCRGRAARE